MKKPSFTKSLIALLLFLNPFHLFSQAPSNDDCANAISLSTALTCTSGVNSFTGQTLSGATQDGGSITSTCTAVNSQDVWYKFVAQCVKPTIRLSNFGTSWGTRLKVQLLSGTCGSFTEVACSNNTTPSATFNVTPGSNLTLGNTYYIRVHKNNTTTPTGSNWGFDICLLGAQQSRMGEVFKQTVIDNGTINKPWEVTYGPDGYLWVTGSQDYKAYRMDPNTGTKTTILDISRLSNTSELTGAEHTTFNVGFSSFSGGITTDGTTNVMAPAAWGSVKVPWPQGGFAGLAIHPQFNSGKPYVYISYVRKYDSTSGTNKGGFYFRNNLVRFTYNSGTNKLESPVAICDTLPGSNDHNSQRIIIAPVGGVDYLFYGQGDMGAGQLNTQWRPNHAQDTTGPSSYEGKILRFNLEPDADAGTYDKWIPDDNPYNHGGVQSAIWAIGIRNNQGFAYNPSTGVLYGSSHGPYTDDEINIIERYKNYGHPLIEGYSWDGNYNGNSTPGTSTSYSAGETYATNTGLNSLAPIGNESTNAATINASGFAPYEEPLFSAYASGGPGYPAATKTVAAIWGATTKPGNAAWPSEAWSGMDVYNNTLIPGWKNSLVVCGLKWGRVLRLKLDAAGTTVVPTNSADTVAYWQGPNGYRDIAFAPDGKEIFVSIDRTNASGPAGVAPTASVAACTSCIIKYTFLGYADANGKSTIPAFIDVTEAPAMNTITSGTTVTIDATNNYLWVPITGPDGNILAEIKANGQNLGTVTSAFYEKSGAIRVRNGVHYLSRNMTITPTTQPTNPVDIRLYISKAEYDALDADPASGINGINNLMILKNEDPISTAIASNTTLVVPNVAELHGTDGYVLQGSISSFSSFYFASGNITLPLNLLTFNGSLLNNTTLLNWETTNEINTSKFLVERSTDGQNFQQIGTVMAMGNSAVNNKYSFTDYDVTRQSSSVVYYRLKMVDNDGAYTYSNIITITLPYTTGKVALFPNPASHDVTVSITTAVDGKVKWQLIDNTGRIVIHNSISVKKGNNNVVININSLANGSYYLSVIGAGIDQKLKLEKL